MALRKILTLAMLYLLTTQIYAQTNNAAQALVSLGKRDIEATTASLIQYAGQGDWITIQLLLQAGVKVDSVDPIQEQTALHAAAAQGHERIVRELLQLGAKVNSVDKCGNTALINAAYAGHLSVVKILLQNAGVESNHKAKCGLTPLVAAVLGGNARVILVVLEAKADPLLPDTNGVTPILAAQRKKREDITLILSSK